MSASPAPADEYATPDEPQMTVIEIGGGGSERASELVLSADALENGQAAGRLPSDEVPTSAAADAVRADTAENVVEQSAPQKLSLTAGPKQRIRQRKVNRYYSRQNELLDSYAKDKQAIEQENGAAIDADKEVAQRKRDSLFAKIVLGVNVVLLVLKIIAAVITNSMSVVSTVVDSVVDLTSGAVIWVTMWMIENHSPYEYPRGRNRLEPIAVVIIGIIMAIGNGIVILESVLRIIDGPTRPSLDWAFYTIYSLGTAAKLLLYVYMRVKRFESPSMQVLQADQRNDIITNIVGASCAIVGYYWEPIIDLIGAILVCGYVACAWTVVAVQQLPLLSGKTASNSVINRIVNVTLAHHPKIEFIDTLFVYHYGEKFLVELHIVLDGNMTLRESHDISEPLQLKLLRLDEVERVFIHCDYDESMLVKDWLQ